jgi:hypothetical protein
MLGADHHTLRNTRLSRAVALVTLPNLPLPATKVWPTMAIAIYNCSIRSHQQPGEPQQHLSGDSDAEINSKAHQAKPPYTSHQQHGVREG